MGCIVGTTQTPRVRSSDVEVLLLGVYWGAIPTRNQGRRKRNRYRQVELRVGAVGLESRQEQAPQRGVYSSTKAIWQNS